MNNEIQLHQQQAPTIMINNNEEASKAFSITNLIFHPYAMERINAYAEEMAKAKNLLPQAFNNDKEACKALLIKAGSLSMDPYAIGAHAFKSPNGTIGFEAKVYQAIAQAAGGIEFDEEYSDGWERVIGNTVEKQGSGGGKYRAPNWKQQDETGLYVDLTGTWPSGKTKTLRVYMAECQPRLSTNWANDPRLQTYYSAIKKWLRRYAPALIMGIFDNEDLSAKESGNERQLNDSPRRHQRVRVEQIEDVDDILNGDVIENTQSDAVQNVKSEDITDIDALMNEEANCETGEISVSKHQEIKDFIMCVTDRKGYTEARQMLEDGKNKKQLSQREIDDLNKLFADLYQTLVSEAQK